MGFLTAPQPVIDRNIFRLYFVADFIFFLGGRQAVTTDTSERIHTPAEKNVWYNLLTIAGEFERDVSLLGHRLSEKSQAILHANRRYWNGYFHHCLDKKERSHFGDTLPRLDDEELAHIHHVMEKRGFDSLPTDVSSVDLAFADAGAMDLVLEGFCFQALNCQDLKIEGSIDLSHAKIVFTVDLSQATIAGSVALDHAKIDGDVDLSHATIDGPVAFIQAEIAGSVALDHAKIDGDVDLSHAMIDRAVAFIRAKIAGSVALDHAKIDGIVNLILATIDGSVRLRNAKIDGTVSLTKAKVAFFVNLSRATTAGSVNLDSATLGGPVDLRDTKIDGAVDLEHTNIDGPLWLDQAHIYWYISCMHTSTKGLEFSSVTCGHADFTDAHFDGPCNFADTKFNEVPKFFGTQLHEDTNWRGVKWPKAATDREKAAERIRRYDRLRLIMSQLKKPFEEQHFRALSLREQRARWPHPILQPQLVL